MATAAIIVMAALAAGSSAYGMKQQADVNEAQAKSAENAATADYMAIDAAAVQTGQAATQEAMKLKRQALIERGRIVAAQSETGFFGNSPLREMLNARLKEKEALGTNKVNYTNALMQGGRDSTKVFADLSGRINETRAKTTNNWAAGLQIVSAGVGGGVSGYTATRKPTKGVA
jgi:hypothetical protein